MAIQIRNRQRSKSLNSRKIRKELEAALIMLGFNNAELSVSFVSSSQIKTLNESYRGIPKETDVLSFPMEDGSTKDTADQRPLMLGDIVISVPKAICQAAEYNTSFDSELRRLLIHGLLHLIGYDHETGAYEKRRMEKKEKELRDALEGLDKQR